MLQLHLKMWLRMDHFLPLCAPLLSDGRAEVYHLEIATIQGWWHILLRKCNAFAELQCICENSGTFTKKRHNTVCILVLPAQIQSTQSSTQCSTQILTNSCLLFDSYRVSHTRGCFFLYSGICCANVFSMGGV